MLSHVFTTPISRVPSGLGTEQLQAAVAELLLMQEHDPGEQKSNHGGWHSTGNLLAGREQPPWDAVRAAVTQAVFDYIGTVFAYSGPLELSLVAWAVINRPGDFNVMHNHAAHLLSGVLYLQVPPGMVGGEIYFQDPRLNLNAHETEAMLRLPLLPPWHTAGIPVTPTEGDILVFPSWLMHSVHPFTDGDAAARRVVLSFNARV